MRKMGGNRLIPGNVDGIDAGDIEIDEVLEEYINDLENMKSFNTYINRALSQFKLLYDTELAVSIIPHGLSSEDIIRNERFIYTTGKV